MKIETRQLNTSCWRATTFVDYVVDHSVCGQEAMEIFDALNSGVINSVRTSRGHVLQRVQP